MLANTTEDAKGKRTFRGVGAAIAVSLLLVFTLCVVVRHKDQAANDISHGDSLPDSVVKPVRRDLESGASSGLSSVDDQSQAQEGSSRRACQFNIVRGSWTSDWKWLNDGCLTDLPQATVNSCVSRFTKIQFLGDSMTHYLFSAFKQDPNFGCVETKTGSRCGAVSNYLGFQPVTTRINPDRTKVQGPQFNGKTSPGCTDCAGCEPALDQCTVGGKREYFEYFPVEFAKDVEQQSTVASTTQENIAKYLAATPIAPSVIILNTGLHDSIVNDPLVLGTGDMTNATFNSIVSWYEYNFWWYVNTLHTNLAARVPTPRYIFITTTPKNMKYFWAPYTNVLIQRMNAVATQIAKNFGFQIIDAYPLLESARGQSLYIDSLHANFSYFSAVKSLVVRKLCALP